MHCFLEAHPDYESFLIGLLGKPKLDPDSPELAQRNRYIEKASDLCRYSVNIELQKSVQNVRPIGVDSEHAGHKVAIKGNFLWNWCLTAEDPGLPIMSWAGRGAPMGLTASLEEFDFLHSRADPGVNTPVEQLASDFDTFTNYAGVEDNLDAEVEIEKYIAQGYFQAHDSIQDCAQFVKSPF